VSPPLPGAADERAHGSLLGPRLTAAAEALALAGGALMLATACLVTTSVLMRWLAGDGISGDFELVQIATALGAFAFLPLCQGRHGNVIVDTFTARLPQRARRTLDALWDLTYAALSGVIAWRLAIGAQDAFASQTTSMVLGIPQGYAIAACAAMGVFLAAVAVATAVRVRKGAR
jgi:TRAP-type C4-dicarboxylate transport system permease small subunit